MYFGRKFYPFIKKWVIGTSDLRSAYNQSDILLGISHRQRNMTYDQLLSGDDDDIFIGLFLRAVRNLVSININNNNEVFFQNQIITVSRTNPRDPILVEAKNKLLDELWIVFNELRPEWKQ